MEHKKYLAIMIALLLIIISNLIVAAGVLSGRFGEPNAWKIAFTIMGTLIISGVSGYFLIRLKELI